MKQWKFEFFRRGGILKALNAIPGGFPRVYPSYSKYGAPDIKADEITHALDTDGYMAPDFNTNIPTLEDYTMFGNRFMELTNPARPVAEVLKENNPKTIVPARNIVAKRRLKTLPPQGVAHPNFDRTVMLAPWNQGPLGIYIGK